MKKLIYHLDQQEAKMKSLLYIMDRYQISLEGYHELTQLYGELPRSYAIEKLQRYVSLRIMS